jgi:hypothetical protein
VVEEIIGRLSDLTGAQLRRLEEELRRERQRRASFEGGGEGAPRIQVGATLPLTEVLEYRPHEDGYLQLELRRYVRRDGSARERGPYWYFQYHEGGKRLLRQNPRPREHLSRQAVKALGGVGRSRGLALYERTRSVGSRRLGPRKDGGRDTGAKLSPTDAYRNRTATGLVQSRT